MTAAGGVFSLRAALACGAFLPRSLRWVQYSLFGLPVLWLAGVDGFLWMVLFPALLIDLVSVRRGKVLVSELTFAGAALFMLAFMLSGSSIDIPMRYLTWMRDGCVIAMMFATMALISRTDRNIVFQSLVPPVAMVMTFSALLGVAALAFNFKGTIDTPMYYLLPDSITSTGFAGNLLRKSIFHDSFFAGILYPRFSGAFAYATSNGLVTMLFMVFLVATGLHRCSRLLLIAGLLCLPAMLLTTARTAFVTLLLGIYIAMLWSPHRWQKITVWLITGLVAATLFVFHDGISALLEQFLTLRGGGSTSTRGIIYQQTILAILDNPLGYGTQRDIPGLGYPLGSHSNWLGLLFKYGVGGFAAVLLMLLGLVWHARGLRPVITRSTLAVGAALLAAGMTEELYLDAIVALIIGVLMGACLSSSTLPPHLGLTSVKLPEPVP